MGRPLISVPPKPCDFCKAMMERKRFNGRLEDVARFCMRKYCNQDCMAKAFVKEEVEVKTYHQRARAHKQASCSQCGSESNLHVHHKDENVTNNDPANLQTLCASCHLKWHWKNGKKPWKERSVCTICGAPSKQDQMCQKHFQRFKRHGSPYAVKYGGKLRLLPG